MYEYMCMYVFMYECMYVLRMNISVYVYMYGYVCMYVCIRGGPALRAPRSLVLTVQNKFCIVSVSPRDESERSC
jgi:hypothetical protein